MSVIKNILNRIGLMSKADVEAMMIEQKSSSEFGKLWLTAKEWGLTGEKVTKPYEQVSSVYKAVKAIADNVPQADLTFVDKRTDKVIESDEIVDLFNSPNPAMNESDFIQAWVGFQVLYGESIIVKTTAIGNMTGARKLPAELWPFNPRDFQEHTKLINGIPRIQAWKQTATGIQFKPEEVMYQKDFNPYNMVRGISPITPSQKMIDIDWLSLIYNKAFFENDATPSMLLTTEQKLHEDTIKSIRNQLEKRHKGASNAFKLAILQAGLKMAGEPQSHKDMDFIEQKKFAREEILGIWRAPKALFNITEDLNYATYMGQMKIFWNYSIMPVLRKIEDTINKNIVIPYNPNIRAKFDYQNVIAYQEDLKDKVETGSKLFTMGFTGNEINERLALGFEPKDWRDKWWITFGMTPADEYTNPSDLPADEPPEPDDDDKDKKKSPEDMKNLVIWRKFLVKQTSLEDRMSSAVSKFFFDQRKEVLAEVMKTEGRSANISWDEQDRRLKTKISPYILLSIKEGVAFGQDMLGRTKSIESDKLNARVQSYMSVRADKITRVNDTVKRLVNEGLAAGIKDGETVLQLADRVRNVYNMATGRSLMIARTETTGAVNGGSQLYYEEEGVKQKKWLTSHDEHVRETHRQIDGQTVPLGQKFDNGLMFPGDMDGEAKDIVNCRCTMVPVVK